MKKSKEIKFFTKKHEFEVIEEIKEALRMCFKNGILELYHENKYFGFDISINIKEVWLTIFFYRQMMVNTDVRLKAEHLIKQIK